MRIPNYQIIEIEKYSTTFQFDEIINAETSAAPIALDISKMEKIEAEEFVLALENELKLRMRSPLFPYPIYVISNHKFISSLIPKIQKITQLPKHFKLKNGLLKKNELLLLNKVKTLRDKIAHSFAIEQIEKTKSVLMQAKELKNLCNEASDYINILEKLNKHERTKK